jgi:hypothetical protein
VRIDFLQELNMSAFDKFIAEQKLEAELARERRDAARRS